jgi:hypothetical protein
VKVQIIRKDYIIIILIVALVGVVSFSSAYMLASQPKNINNSTSNSNNSINSSINSSNMNTSSNKTSKNTASIGNNIDLNGYVLTEVRDSTGLNPGKCKFCKKWSVYRTVYDYKNNEDDRIMIGKNYFTSCGRKFRNMWQNGKWSDI